MASTIKQLQERKRKLLERYRSARLEEQLLVARQQAIEEAERGRFPWKGAFRSKEEIEALYAERKKWDRRFLVDTIMLSLVLIALTLGGSYVVKVVSPKPSQTREALMAGQGGQAAPVASEAATDAPAGD